MPADLAGKPPGPDAPRHYALAASEDKDVVVHGHNEFRLSIGAFAFADNKRRTPSVQIDVDDEDLFGLIERAGRTDPTVGPIEGSPGLTPEEVAPPSRHWLGSPAPALSDGDDVVVYLCECGDWGCGGVLARITVTDDHVVWSDFHGPQGQTYEVGPFHFDRRAYEQQLAQLAS